MKSQRKQFAATSHNFPILRDLRAFAKDAGNETQNSNPSAPATFEVRKRRRYAVCGHFAILCFFVLNAFSDGIFVRFCTIFEEKCRISVV